MSKKKWNGEDFLVGKYQLGYMMVDVWAMSGEGGGRFNLCCDDKHPFMYVSLGYPAYCDAHAVLCHEAMEAVLTDMGLSYKPLCFVENASDVRHFMFNHNQFSEVASRVSYFLLKCHDDMLAAHKIVQKWKKKQKL